MAMFNSKLLNDQMEKTEHVDFIFQLMDEISSLGRQTPCRKALLPGPKNSSAHCWRNSLGSMTLALGNSSWFQMDRCHVFSAEIPCVILGCQAPCA
jgi:hypothetical protein